MSYFLLALFTYFASYIGVYYIRRWAERSNRIDVPNDRSSHSRPTPSGGGLAIVFSVVLGVCLYAVGIL